MSETDISAEEAQVMIEIYEAKKNGLRAEIEERQAQIKVIDLKINDLGKIVKGEAQKGNSE